jgi:HTH-type transcriptional regulator/antitoxin HigA
MTNAVCEAYGKLLKEKTPHAIRNRKEYDEARNELRVLMLEERLAPEEREYLDLLSTLVEAYEREHVRIRKGSSLDILHELMDARDMKQVGLAKLVGSSGTASEIYNGKREISKMLAKKLGTYFRVDYTLFL